LSGGKQQCIQYYDEIEQAALTGQPTSGGAEIGMRLTTNTHAVPGQQSAAQHLSL